VRLASDGAILRQLLVLHAPATPRILDATYGAGVMWTGLDYQPVRMDIREDLDVDVHGDWPEMPRLFAPASFDVVVFDPPHVLDAGDGIVGDSGYAERYGTHATDLFRGADNIGHLYATFLHAARGVLQPRTGVVLAKIADQVHVRQQWQHVEFVTAARAAGFTPCDYAIKWRTSAPIDPRWRNRYHVAKPWSFWIVARAGTSCQGPGELRIRQCAVCGRVLEGRRDAVTCSGRCREKRRRARGLDV
jgi:hypothetical protein